MPSSIILWIFVLITIIDSMNAEVFPEYMDMKIKFYIPADLKVDDLQGLKIFIRVISMRIPISSSTYDEKVKVCVEFTNSDNDWMVAASVTEDMSLHAVGKILEKIEDHRRQKKSSERCEKMDRPGAHHILIIVKRDKHDETEFYGWMNQLSSTYVGQDVTAAVVVNTFNEKSKFTDPNKFGCIIQMIGRLSWHHNAKSMQESSVEMVNELWTKIQEGFSKCDYNVDQIPPCHYAKGGECVMQKTVELTKNWLMACARNSKRLSKCQDHAECDDTCNGGFQNRPCSLVSGKCAKTLPIGDRLLENCKKQTQECKRIECPGEPPQATTNRSMEAQGPSTAKETVYKMIGQNLMVVGFVISFVSGLAWIIMSCIQWRQEKIEAESPAAKMRNEKIDGREANAAKGGKSKCLATVSTKSKTSVTKGKKKESMKKR